MALRKEKKVKKRRNKNKMMLSVNFGIKRILGKKCEPTTLRDLVGCPDLTTVDTKVGKGQFAHHSLQ